MKRTAGRKLLNGATVIARKCDLSSSGFIALCVKENGEYVTWITDEAGNAYHGHYTVDFQKAVAEFNERS